MRGGPRTGLIAWLLAWWKRLRQRLHLYEQRNLAEWQYWGKKRADREVGEESVGTESRDL